MENDKIKNNVRSWLTDPNLTEQDIHDSVNTLIDSFADKEGKLWINCSVITTDTIYLGKGEV